MVTKIEFEVGGKSYAAQQLPPKKQLKVAKRLLPLMSELLTPEFLATVKKQEGKVVVDPARVLPAIAQAFHKLSDEDVDTICALTLSSVQRKEGTGWSTLATPDGDLMHNDVNMPQMLEIVWKVIEGNLGDFFSTSP